MKVLFVDDEPHVLEGIERSLFTLDCDWDVQFASSGAAALKRLEDWSADIVVSDMRMPGMDGAELLTRVKQRWPDTLRVILSGYTEQEAAFRAMHVSHQFLAKPCQGGDLVEALNRLIIMRDLVPSRQLREMLGDIAELPPSPRIYLRLRHLLEQDSSGTGIIASVMEQDPALSSTVLKLANSTFFRRSHPIVSVHAAVMRLGVSLLHNLVLTAECYPPQPGVDVEQLRERSLLASLLVRKLAPSGIDVECCVSAALLAHVSALLPKVVQAAQDEGGAVSPAQIAAYLLGIWGLPLPIVYTVARHQRPLEHEPQRFGAIGVVHAAIALADSSEPDFAYLEQVGMAAQWPSWLQMVEVLRHDQQA